MNFENRFDEQVVSNFIREYTTGRTPIPCAHCNADLKFSTLLERSLGFGADGLATGHYARMERAADGTFVLRRGADEAKDQTYFLFSLTQQQLARAWFPVGHLDKAAVREHARRLQLRVAAKPDSQEICFIPDGDYAAFVERAAPELTRARRARRSDRRGRRVARRASIGSRLVSAKGLGLSASEPLYVLAIRPETGEVVVGPRAALGRTTLTASQVNWVSGQPATDWTAVDAQISHRHIAAPARVRAIDARAPKSCSTSLRVRSLPDRQSSSIREMWSLGGGWID